MVNLVHLIVLSKMSSGADMFKKVLNPCGQTLRFIYIDTSGLISLSNLYMRTYVPLPCFPPLYCVWTQFDISILTSPFQSFCITLPHFS